MYLQVFVSLFLLHLIFFLTISVPQSLGHNQEKYLDCFHPFECGKFKANYPFWGHHRPSICGRPELELECKDQSIALIFINGVKYNISNINETSQTLRISRVDYQEGFCKPQFGNTTLLSPLLNYSSNIEMITFFYDCSSSPELTRMRELDCSDGNHYVCEEGTDDAPRDCRNNVNLPIKNNFTSHKMEDLSVLKQGLKEGFEVKWNANGTEKDCRECMKSNGTCTYDPENNQMVCYCLDESGALTTCPASQGAPASTGRRNWVPVVKGILAGLGGTALLFVLVVSLPIRNHLSCQSLVYQKNQNSNNEDVNQTSNYQDVNSNNEDVNQTSNYQDVEAFIRNNISLTPKHYKYSDVKKMTSSFLEKIGQGGYGAVYKGKLSNGRIVAVKILRQAKENEQNGEEFMNEVACISRCSHVNIVNLLGFCYERHKRALIYEYMPNGSLDKFIYNQASLNSNPRLEWKVLHQIVVGVARGLEYLHRGCATRIVHFDIKPHNILLDEHFCPKISDFGLAKQCKNKESIISMLNARGTIGYIAPEVIFRHFGEVSYKSDVYGYGMMVLEMVGIRRNIAHGVPSNSEKIFPDWIYELIEIKDDLTLHEMVATTEDEELLRKMILVSLWCIQINPLDRPLMSKAVEMLEGELQSLQIPPKPVLYTPSDPLQDSSIASDHCLSIC